MPPAATLERPRHRAVANHQTRCRRPQRRLVSQPANLVDLRPELGRFSLPELRYFLGLERVLTGSKVRRVVYCDRYLRSHGAEILAYLLQGEWLDAHSEIVVQILQDGPSGKSGQRKARVEHILHQVLRGRKVKLTVKMMPWEQRDRVPHRRELVIHRRDGKVHRVLFDKGMDFLKAEADGQYRIAESTYVVVT